MRVALPITLRRLGLTLLCVAVAACVNTTAPDPGTDPATETFAASLGVDLSQMVKVSRVLYTQDIAIGTGTSLGLGDIVTVSYAYWLKDGTLIGAFDESNPFQFGIGNSNIIDGLSAGVIGMKAGGTRLIVMGSSLAFGVKGAGTVPPNSTLVYQVSVISVP
jgi:FKBP-type peptidyl-prolyl cis-trans isomerase